MLLGIGALALSFLLGVTTLVVPGNEVSRTLEVSNARLHTRAIQNAAAGMTIRAAGPEFVITYGQGNTANSESFSVVAVDETGAGPRVTLVDERLGLQAEIEYGAAARGPWLYKTITFKNLAAKPFLLRTVEVEHLNVVDESVTYSVDPAFPSLSDWGQPVYTDSLWFGLEFPAARSAATGQGSVFLRHHPGVELQPGEAYTTKRAVLGGARPGQVSDAFMEYVASLTPAADPPRVNIYWNGFRVVDPPNRTQKGLAMIEIARKLRAETGFTFDGWSYDAGSNMYRPDALFVPNESDLWDESRAALRDLATPLGFWASFSSIFDTPTHAWGMTQGFELQHASSYCLAGPVYYQAIRARLEEIVRTYGMNTINFDGMAWGQGFGCNTPGHGHLVGEGSEVGVYSTERVVEHELEILYSLRSIHPGIVLDHFVCNEWASPWWLSELDAVHTVVGDAPGCDVPSPWLRDELITARDIQAFDAHRRRNRQFPLWAEDLYGTQVRRNLVLDGVAVEGEAMTERWEDEYVLALAGRGTVASQIVCSDLGLLDESRSGLQFFGDVGTWTRRNASLYRHAQLIGGEPAKRQPYGYSHGDHRGRSLVALRNPWLEPRSFELTLDEQLGLGPVAEPVDVTIVYPYRESVGRLEMGASVSIALQDYEVMLLEVRQASRQFADVPQGERWAVDDQGATRICDRSRLTDLPDGRLVLSVRSDVLTLEGVVHVPTVAQAGLVQVMFLPDSDEVQTPTAWVDGSATPVELHTRRRGQRTDAWALIAVGPGEHDVVVRVPTRGSGHLGAWLRADYNLLTAQSKAITAPQGDLFPVHDAGADRRVATLLPETAYVTPPPGLPESASVPLATLRERCVASSVGYFHLGWDESCWPADPVLRIGDRSFAHGIGVHAPSSVTVDIDGAFTRFRAEVGMHGVPAAIAGPEARPGSSAFIVEGDGVPLYTSPVLKEGDPALAVDVDITGVSLLTLRTTDGGDSNFDDLGTWGDARVER